MGLISTPIFIGCDLASGPDQSAEVVYRVLPGGRFEIVSVHPIPRTIDLGTAEYVVEPRHRPEGSHS